MTPDEAIEKARWYEREDIATTLREEANVLADEVERLRGRVARLEEALRPFVACFYIGPQVPDDTRFAYESVATAGELRAARAALEGSK